MRPPTHRVVMGLEEVRLGPGPFVGKAKPRASGTKALGLRYEKALAKLIPEAKHGLWINFKDLNGWGWCQPDLLVRNFRWKMATGREQLWTLILEAKLSYTVNGHLQIEELYAPVVERLWGQPCLGIVVCKHLSDAAEPKIITDNLRQALDLAARGRSILHWMGNSIPPPHY